MTSTLEVPIITPHDLSTFHETHLAPHLQAQFTTTFFTPQAPPSPSPPLPASTALNILPEPLEEADEDDGLGCYPDGVKRTLTPAQVAMFRFSEIQSLLRRERRATAKKAEDEQNMQDPQTQNHPRDRVMVDAPMTTKNTISPEEQRKSRLEAAMWASSLPWDDQVKEERRVPKVVETADAGTGKNFLWPAIERG